MFVSLEPFLAALSNLLFIFNRNGAKDAGISQILRFAVL